MWWVSKELSVRNSSFAFEEMMETMKNNSLLRLLLVSVGLLVGAALATAQSQIILAGGSQGVAMDIISASSAQLTFGECNEYSCASSGNAVVTNSKGSAVSLGTWNLVLNGGGPLTLSSAGILDGPPSGTFTFKSDTGVTGTITGTATITSVAGSSSPQFNIHVNNFNGAGNLASLFPQGGTADLNYVASRLVCTSSVTGGCTFQNLMGATGATAEAGSKYGRLAPESETTAAFLLGTGLFGLALVLRRRHKLTHTEA
jgi:hypothetical protein